MAGDLTIYGMRDNVKLIRTGQDNKQEIITMDLNKAETVLSPYYQLQQNDIIYVTPNKTKAKNSDVGTSTGLWFSGVSILVSLATLLVTILKIIYNKRTIMKENSYNNNMSELDEEKVNYQEILFRYI